MVRIKSILRRKNLLIFIFTVFLFITLHIAQAEKLSLMLLEDEKDIAFVTHSKTLSLKEGQNFVTFDLPGEKIIEDSLYAQLRGARLLEQRITLPSTLSLVVEGISREEVEVNLSYLAEGLNWEVNYQAELNPEEETLSISCFLRVENKQKKNLQDIELGFMKEAYLLLDQTELLIQEEKKDIKALSDVKCDVRINLEKEAEYFLYKLKRPVTLFQGEDATFLLFSFADIPCKKIYLYDGEKYGEMVIKKIVFKTPSGENSDIVFPSGNLYVYKKRENGSKIYLGKETLNMLFPGKKAQIDTGIARGIDAQRIQTLYREVPLSEAEKMIYNKDIAREYGYRIILSNRYPFKVAVKVVEHFYGLWEILESSPMDFERKENIIIYTLEIPPQGKRIITYRAKTM